MQCEVLCDEGGVIGVEQPHAGLLHDSGFGTTAAKIGSHFAVQNMCKKSET